MTLVNEPIKRAEVKPKVFALQEERHSLHRHKSDFLMKFINEQGKNSA